VWMYSLSSFYYPTWRYPSQECRRLLLGCIVLRMRGKYGFKEASMSEDVGMSAGDSPPPATLLQMMTGY
jgi:hypothetical protein